MDITGYHFGGYYLDLAKKQISLNHQVIELNQRSITLLSLLAEQSPDPLSKQQLHQVLWPETVVSDWSLSRLVSDCRIALGDDGEHQNIIKTARGKGFYMPNVVPEHAQPIAHNSINKFVKFYFPWLIPVLASLFIFSFFYWQKAQNKQQLVTVIAAIAHHQDNAYVAFKAQAKRRNQLVSMIEKRLGFERQQQFELFFQSYYSKMNEQEKFVCQQVRAFSDTGLFKNNAAVLTLIEQNPEVIQIIPLANKLSEHLHVWLDKYQSVFTQRQDMCLVYVGVEDGVPYPSGVDKQIKEWLSLHSK